MDDDKARVREASDIVRVVGEHLTLHPKGREFVGLCPFHDDSKPSMYVVPGKQIFHCFACGAGGDVFTFVQRYHGMEFGEALKFLAERAGIELTPRRAPEPGSTAGPTRRELVEANAFALKFYRAVLEHESHGKAARELIEKRGISAKMVERFELGAAPDQWDGLATAAARRSGLKGSAGAPTPRVLELAGLVKARENGQGHYDALRDRLVFPIHDQVGRVVAFGGRRLSNDDEKGPKYLNSPETPVFNKSRTLYGLAQASRAIQKERTAIVVEGYVDVVTCHQFGFEHAVGTLGTALTVEHAQMLRRLADEVVLVFDGDEAGQRAAARAVEVFFSEPIDVRIVTIGGETGLKDPDDLLKSEGGPEAFGGLLESAEGLFEYRFGRLRTSLSDKGPAAVDEAVQAELRRLVDLGLNQLNPMLKSLTIKKIATAAGVSEVDLRQLIPAGRRSAAPKKEPRPEVILMSAAEAAIGCILAEPKLARTMEDDVAEEIRAFAYTSDALRALAGEVIEALERGERVDLQRVLDLELAPETAQAAVGLHQRLEKETDGDPTRLRRVWDDSVARLLATRKVDTGGDLAERLEQARAAAGHGPRAAHPGVKRSTPR